MLKKTTLSLLATLLLAACAPLPPADAPTGQGDPRPPVVENLTPFPNLSLTGVDQFGEYSALGLKITYVLQDDGQLVPELEGQEPMIDEHTPTDQPYACKTYGARYNQTTTWFPDTGVFVRGARVTALLGREGQPRPLVALAEGDQGVMAVAGPQARALEYGYVPCVGAHRVEAGVRSVGHMEPGERLQLEVPKGQGGPQEVILPEHPRPVVWLDFAGRTARAIAPADLVLLTVDVPRRRVVAQYQLTVAMQPQVALARWTVVLPQAALARDAALQQVNQAVAELIAHCVPNTRPMGQCTNPHQHLPELLRR